MSEPFWELPQDPAAQDERPPPNSKRRRWTLRLLRVAVVAALVAVLGLATAIVVGYQSTKELNPNQEFQTATTTVFYNDGKSEIGTFQIQNRQPLTYDEMPDNVKQAVVAAENRSFWTDRGVSIRGMVRAAWVIARGGDVQGGSTITQQYIKILYLDRSQTFTRKFKELFLAARINRSMSKQEVLAGYLNTIYFGRDAYGIQAASRAYFDVDAKDLTLPQAAVLASVLNNPSAFDPAEDDAGAQRLLGRYRYVLQSMAETGALTPGEATTYGEKLPAFPKIKADQRYGGPKGFLLKMVQKELTAAGFDATQVNGGGLQITTTFDKQDQRAAVRAAQRYTEQSADAAGKKAANLHAAIASVEVGSGEVLALYGGPDFVENSRNWATTPRPTASTFKAYALAAGLEDGYSLLSRFNGNTFTPPGETKPIRNEYSRQYGRVNLIRATADSVNTAFVDLVTSMKSGASKVTAAAEAAGAPRGAGWDTTARNLPLGTPEVSPLAQAGAFATFGNEGTYVPNHVVREVRDADGKLLYQAKPAERRAMSKDVAADVTYALSSVVEEGTGRTVQTLNRPVAGKTGTKDRGDDITSAWFVAYTKQVSTAVMYVAGDSGDQDLDGYRRPGDSTFFGGTYPALTWEDYMETATDGMKVEEFEPPAYVNRDEAEEAESTRTPEPEPTATRSTEPEPSETESTESSEPSATGRPTRSSTAGPSSSRPTSTRSPADPESSEPTSSASRRRSEPTSDSTGGAGPATRTRSDDEPSGR